MPPKNSCFFLFASKQICVFLIFKLSIDIVELSFVDKPIVEFKTRRLDSFTVDFSPTDNALSLHSDKFSSPNSYFPLDKSTQSFLALLI